MSLVPGGADDVGSSSPLSPKDEGKDGGKAVSLATAEQLVTSASHESIRMGGSIDGLPQQPHAWQKTTAMWLLWPPHYLFQFQ